MLVLTRYAGERIRLTTASGEEIWVVVTEVERGKCRLAIEAPQTVIIQREELLPPSERHFNA